MELSEQINCKLAPPRSPYPSDIYDFLAEIKPEVAKLEAELATWKDRAGNNFREAMEAGRQREDMCKQLATAQAELAECMRVGKAIGKVLRECEAELKAHKENEGDECPLCACEDKVVKLEAELERYKASEYPFVDEVIAERDALQDEVARLTKEVTFFLNKYDELGW